MPTFPAFEDQEPPPLTRRQRLRRVGVVVGTLSLVAAATLTASAVRNGRNDDAAPAANGTAEPSPSTSGDRTGAPSGILWYDSERLAVADPDGGRRQRISTDFPTTQPRFQLTVAPDRKSAVTDDGYLVALDRSDLAPPQRVLPADLTNAYVPASAFGDSGRTIVVDLGQGGKPGVSVLTLASGRLQQIANGAAPAADPRTTGAAYATGLKELPGADPGGGQETFLDSERLERVAPDNFAPPVVLMRKTDLLQLMGLPPKTPAGFTQLGFAPDGEHVFFTAVADTRDAGPYGPTGRWAVGIVARNGDLKAFKALDRLHFPNSPVWSPAGNQLAFLDFANVSRLERAEATPLVWSLGAGPVSAPQQLQPAEGQQPFSHGFCVWKPDGTALLCGDERAWYVMPTAGGAATVAESVPGVPVAWVGP